MCDLFFTLSAAVFEAMIRVKSMYVIKPWFKTRKRKCGNQTIFLRKYPSEGCRGEL